jgi:hypothetical protein
VQFDVLSVGLADELRLKDCGFLLGCGRVGRPGGDLLSRVLRHSTMGAGDFHGRVRDGIGCGLPAKTTRSSSLSAVVGFQSSVVGQQARQAGVGVLVLLCVPQD